MSRLYRYTCRHCRNGGIRSEEHEQEGFCPICGARGTEPVAQECGNCRHFRRVEGGTDEATDGRCWRNPPTPVFIGAREGDVFISRRPGVDADTPACGEFRPTN